MQKSKEGKQKRLTRINPQEGHQSKVKVFVKNKGTSLQQALAKNLFSTVIIKKVTKNLINMTTKQDNSKSKIISLEKVENPRSNPNLYYNKRKTQYLSQSQC